MNDARTVAIIQARLGSSRLPRKVLADLGGRPVLQWLVQRLARATLIDSTIVATTTEAIDDDLVDWCEREGVPVYRGPLDDVLTRFLGAATEHGADIIVRITADCPLVEPTLVDRVIRALVDDRAAYAALDGPFPDGLDCEAMTYGALAAAAAEASLASDREHVTPFLKRHAERFRSAHVRPFEDRGSERWTLDLPQDLAFLRALVRGLPVPALEATPEDVFAALDRMPSLREINAGIVRNAPYLRQVQEEHPGHDAT